MRCGKIDPQLFSAGFLLIIAGFFTVFVGAILLALKGGSAEGGGVVFIGPIPIAFGTSKRAALAALIVGAIMFLMLLAMLS